MQQGRAKQQNTIRNEQLATEKTFQKFKPKLATNLTSNHPQCKHVFVTDLKGFVFEHYRQHFPHVTFHTSMPFCPNFQGRSLSNGHGDGTNLEDAHSLIFMLVVSHLDVE